MLERHGHRERDLERASSRDRDRLKQRRELATPSGSPAAALPSSVYPAPANASTYQRFIPRYNCEL